MHLNSEWHYRYLHAPPSRDKQVQGLLSGESESVPDLNRKVLTGEPLAKDRRSTLGQGAAGAYPSQTAELPRRQLTNWSERRALELSGKVESTPAKYCKLWRLQRGVCLSLFTEGETCWGGRIFNVYTALMKESIPLTQTYAIKLSQSGAWFDKMWLASTCKPVYCKYQQS